MASFLRTWFIRSLIVSALAAGGYGAWFAYSWVSPEQIRTSVIENLRTKLDDSVEVEVESACLRLFGGISITNLKLTKKGEHEPFLTVPSAVITHDKERLNRGELAIRKVEIENAVIRLERKQDGTWNLKGIAKPTSGEETALPAILFKNGTVYVTDPHSEAMPPIAFRNVNGQLLNESLPLLKWDGHCDIMCAAAIDERGEPDPNAMRIRVNSSLRFHRQNKTLNVHLEVPSLDITPDFAPLIAKLHPVATTYGVQLTANASIKADLILRPDATPQYDVKLELKAGKYEDSVLPWPLEQVSGSIRCQDGRVTVDKLIGKFGKANVELCLESKASLFAEGAIGSPTILGPRVRPPTVCSMLKTAWICYPEYPNQDPIQLAEERLEKFEIVVGGLSLDDDLFARLQPKVERIRKMFNPQGGVDVAVKFQRTPDGGWKREVDLRPNKLSIEYEKFHYPIKDLAGSVKKVTASDGTDEFRVNVTGTAGGRRIDLTGKVAGDGPDPHINLRIAGTDIPIDEKLIAALPGKYSTALAKLHAKARGDFVVDIRQSYQVNRCENTFRIRVYNGEVNYDHFPYEFKQVRGNVLVRVGASDKKRPLRPDLALVPEEDTDRVEIRNFEGVHDGGRMWLTGDSEAVPGSTDRKMSLHVQGENWPIDEEFHAALKEMKLDNAISGFSPRGELTFGADVEVWDRSGTGHPHVEQLPGEQISADIIPASAKLPVEPPFNPNTDLRLALNFKGPSVTPSFFPYDLHNLSGVLRYHGGRVELTKFSAMNGTSNLKLEAAEIRFGDGGEVWANLGGITLNPFVPNAAFLKALPPKLKSGFEALNVRGPAEFNLKHMVIRVPPTHAAKPVVTEIRGQAPEIQADRWQAVPITAPKAEATRPYESVPQGTHVVVTTPPVEKSIAISPEKTPTVEVQPAMSIEPVKPPARPIFSFIMPWQKPPVTAPPAVPPKLFPTETNEETIVYWNAALKLTGGSMDAGLTWDEVHGTIACEGRYEGKALGAVVGNAWFEQATIAKQPVTDGKFTYRIRPQQPDPQKPGTFLPPVIEFPDLAATLFHGTIAGQARVTLGESARYRLFLNASGVRLEELAKHYKLGSGADLRGQAQGSVLLENIPDPKTGKLITTGSGQVDVPQGRMYNLPVLLELVKLMKGQTPDGVAFEEAHATFEVKGERIKVTQLDLLGSAVSLGGSGELDTDGQHVKFEFFTIWSQTLKRWLTTPLGDVTSLLSGSLFKIELTRENGKLTPKAHMLPAVTDPVRAVAERLRNRTGKTSETVRVSDGKQ